MFIISRTDIHDSVYFKIMKNDVFEPSKGKKRMAFIYIKKYLPTSIFEQMNHNTVVHDSLP